MPSTTYPNTKDPTVVRVNGQVIDADDFVYQDGQVLAVQDLLGEPGDVIGAGTLNAGPGGMLSTVASGGTALKLIARDSYIGGKLLSVGDDYDSAPPAHTEKMYLDYAGKLWLLGGLQINAGPIVTDIIDDDSMATASAATLATSESIKQYVDDNDYSDPLTTRGDILFRNATITTRLAKGTPGQVLTMGADDPGWSTISAGEWTDQTTHLEPNTTTRTIRIGKGLVGAPGSAFEDDTDTGPYWVSADTYGIAARGLLLLELRNEASDAQRGSLGVIYDSSSDSGIYPSVRTYQTAGSAPTNAVLGAVTFDGKSAGTPTTFASMKAYVDPGSPGSESSKLTFHTLAMGAIATDSAEISSQGLGLDIIGTAAAPSVYWTDHLDTGAFIDASGRLAFTQDGAEALRIETDGSLSVAGNASDYKTLVTDADDIPNKDYVDTAVSSGGGVTSHADLTAAQSATGVSDYDLCYVESLATFYRGDAVDSTTDDGTHVLTCNAGAGRWFAVSGQYTTSPQMSIWDGAHVGSTGLMVFGDGSLTTALAGSGDYSGTIAIGRGIGPSLPTASVDNVFIGDGILPTASSKVSQSVFVGGNILGSVGNNTIGNTFSGYNILSSGTLATSDDYNSFYGHSIASSGLSTDTTQLNSVFGARSATNLNGKNNAVMGADAAQSMARYADNNSIFGYGAADKITSGEGNVILGALAGPTTNQSDRLYIHNAESDTPLILGDFSAGTLAVHSGTTKVFETSSAGVNIGVNGSAGAPSVKWGTTGVGIYSDGSTKGFLTSATATLEWNAATVRSPVTGSFSMPRAVGSASNTTYGYRDYEDSGDWLDTTNHSIHEQVYGIDRTISSLHGVQAFRGKTPVHGQTQTSYDSSPTSEGSISDAGSGHTVGDVITMSDGTKVTVVQPDPGTGPVTEFTVDSTESTGQSVDGTILTQTSTTGAGIDFELTLGVDNLTTIANIGFIGDEDTGFEWLSSGEASFLSDGVSVAEFTSQGVGFVDGGAAATPAIYEVGYETTGIYFSGGSVRNSISGALTTLVSVNGSKAYPGHYDESQTVVSSGTGTTAVDCRNGHIVVVDLADQDEDTIVQAPTNESDGIVLKFVVPGYGSRKVDFVGYSTAGGFALSSTTNTLLDTAPGNNNAYVLWFQYDVTLDLWLEVSAKSMQVASV